MSILAIRDRAWRARLASGSFRRHSRRARSSASPVSWRNVLVSKVADHLSLYRQGQIHDRDGIGPDRSTLADWAGKTTALLEPLADAIGEFDES